MKRNLIIVVLFFFFSCVSSKKIVVQDRDTSSITGSDFYKQAVAYNWQKRDSLAVKEILSGNIPSFLKKLVAINTEVIDSSEK